MIQNVVLLLVPSFRRVSKKLFFETPDAACVAIAIVF
jgi:hypothetical protein